MRVQDKEAQFGNVIFILDGDFLEPRDFRTEASYASCIL